jgi:fibronectin type 3 domain-containing protein
MRFSIGRMKLSALVILGLVLTAPLAFGGQDSLAIFTLTPTNMEAMGYNGEILGVLIQALEQEKEIEIMPRRAMEDALFNAGLVQSSDPDVVTQAGKVLGINFILFGQVTKLGVDIKAEIKLMDVQKQDIMKTWKRKFTSREAISDRIPDFARDLTDTIVNRDQYAVTLEAAGLAAPALEISSLKAVGTGTQVEISWAADPAQSAVGYHVYRASSLAGPYQFVGQTDQTRFTDTSAGKGVIYHYRVGILDGTGREVKSDLTAKALDSSVKQPQPPLVMGGEGFIRRTHIKFIPSLKNDQDNIKIIAYNIYRKPAQAGEWQLVQEVKAKRGSGANIAFEVEDREKLEDGKAYSYGVASVDKKKIESALSDPLKITTVKRPVLSLEKDNLLRENRFTWQALERIKGYRFYRKNDQGEWVRIGDNSRPDKTTYIDKKGKLIDGQVYHYHLTAYDNQKGETGPSNTIQAKTKDRPPYPANLTARGNMVKAVQLTWDPVDDQDVGGYNIYSGTNPDSVKRIGYVRGQAGKAYLDKGPGFGKLDDGATYYYAVESYNLFKADGSISPVVKAITKFRPVKVKGLTATAGTDHILVKWQANPEPDIKTYQLYQSKDGGGWSKLKVLGPSQLSFSDNELRPEATYRYRVIVEDKDGLLSDPVDGQEVKSPLKLEA